MKEYKKRIADKLLEYRLEEVGAVLIEGPKWCGKTTTAEQKAKSVLYMADPDNQNNYLEMANLKIKMLLKGEKPRLIDEWQIIPQIWDAIRFEVDHQGEEGLFILTGSAVPTSSEKIHHTGTGRFAWITMRPMSLWESGESTGEVSISELFKGNANQEGFNKLKLEDIAAQERLGEKSAQNILAGIEASKQVPWARVLFALGIRMVGETTAKKIARKYNTIDALQWATAEQLCAIEDVGPQIAENIVKYFEDIRNIEILDRLRKAGLQMEGESLQPSAISHQLDGMSIVISGTFSQHSRDEYKALIEAHGGKNVGSVSKKTSFILAGENMGPEKRKKAEDLGIRLMTEDEFLELVNGNL